MHLGFLSFLGWPCCRWESEDSGVEERGGDGSARARGRGPYEWHVRGWIGVHWIWGFCLGVSEIQKSRENSGFVGTAFVFGKKRFRSLGQVGVWVRFSFTFFNYLHVTRCICL